MKWKTIGLVVLPLVVGFAVLAKIALRTPEPPAHQVFINGNVLTMDADNHIVQAISVREDRIEAVGNSDEIMALVTNSTVVTDLRGRTLLAWFH